MCKTTALTFAAAVALLVAAVAIEFYGHSIVASQRSAAAESHEPILYDGYDIELETWEKAAGLTGLLAISVSLTGAMLWDREDAPLAARVSILMLDENGPGRISGTAAPLNKRLATKAHVDESSVHLRDDENLTPLERVIRGY